MDTLTPTHLIAISEAHDFAALLQAVSDSAGAVLGEDLAASARLLLSEDDGPAIWLLSARTLERQRVFRPCRICGEWLDLGWTGSGVHLLRKSPARLLGMDYDEPAEETRAPVHTAIVSIVAGERRIGLLMLPLSGEVECLGPEAEDGLAQIAQTLSRVLPNIVRHERTMLQNAQMQHLHEGMVKTLVALNKSALLASLLVILNRHFGLSRIIIAQIHTESQTLRSELHSGFAAGFAPFAIPIDASAHPFVTAMATGEVLIHEGEGSVDWLPDYLKGTRAERRVLLPLMIGLKPVGLIYADQPVHDGSPYFRNIFEILARMAAAALENLNMRLRAEQRAETDALTGLYNRYFLDKMLEIEIPRVKRYNHSISLLMIDLCDFKSFNDTYGHQYGDYILRETASLLQANVRRPDMVVRYGGDEFVVLMVNTTNEQAQMVRRRIEQAFIERNHVQTDERSVIKISIGLRSADASTIETLLHEADVDMYAHKAHQTRLILIEALLSGNVERIEAADHIVGSLCNILYKKAPYYPVHARRVAHLALLLARRLGMPDPEVETLALAALLHDVGTVSIPTEILQKIDPFTPSEVAAMRHHPALGEEFFQGLDHLEPVRPIIRSHHERYDGQIVGDFPGYPDGLAGESIPQAARILKLAESAECMLYGLPYRPCSTRDAVLSIMDEEAGKSFDPNLTRLLLADTSWLEELNQPDRITSLLNLDA